MASLSSQDVPPQPGSLLEEKMALRKIVRKDLRALSSEERAEQDEAVQELVLAAEWFQKSGRMCAYISCYMLREVNTFKIVQMALQPGSGKTVYMPRVEDKGHMRMLAITDSTADVTANSMSILEPTPLDTAGLPREDLMEVDEPVDLILLPGLAFDRSGGRLGRGGGYYDLFLEKYLQRCELRGWARPRLVALAYKEQMKDSVPMDRSDVRVDEVVVPPLP